MRRRRTKSHHLLSYEALFRRLQYRYRLNEAIIADYQKYKAGYYGEQAIDYKLSLFPNHSFFHYPDLRLRQNFNYFQIDSVILTPKLIFIIEAKNLKGTIMYDSKHKQLLQIDEDKEFCYKDPLLQANTQKTHLKFWLRNLGYDVPIEPIVVSTNPHTIIRNIDNHPDFQHRFITLENLPYKLNEIFHQYKKKILSNTDIKKIYSLFDHNNTPLRADLINFYHITSNQLISGIACEHCGFFPIKKHPRKWKCPKCKQVDVQGYERVILDYFLLHQPFITNHICRQILHIPSQDSAYFILKSLKLKTTGANKNRKYLSPSLSEFPQDEAPKMFEISPLGFKNAK